MLVKAINLAVAFFTLNKSVKVNAKSIASEALDIGLAVTKIAKTQKLDKKVKIVIIKMCICLEEIHCRKMEEFHYHNQEIKNLFY